MLTDESLSTPLVDAVRRSHVATPAGLAVTPAVASTELSPPARLTRSAPGWRPPRLGRRAIRITLILGILALSGIWLMRNAGLTGLFRKADAVATEVASTNSTAAAALNLLGFGRIRAAAGAAPICDIRHPSFLYGFAALRAQVGARMGDPLECERAIHPSGDTHQLTTTGLAYYRKGANIPSFAAGEDHWALTDRGLVTWIGDVVDPPGSAVLTSAR